MVHNFSKLNYLSSSRFPSFSDLGERKGEGKSVPVQFTTPENI